MLIVLLRHGETAYNAQRRYQGKSDIPLSARGRARLRAADFAPDVVFVTALCRTAQTAAAIFPGARQAVEDDLREMDFGDFEMHSYEELKDWPSYQKWIEDVEHNPCPNGESAPLVLARNLEAIAPVLAADEDAVCVAHGGVISGLLMTWFGGTRYDYLVRPGTGFAVEVTDGKPQRCRPIPEE